MPFLRHFNKASARKLQVSGARTVGWGGFLMKRKPFAMISGACSRTLTFFAASFLLPSLLRAQTPSQVAPSLFIASAPAVVTVALTPVTTATGPADALFAESSSATPDIALPDAPTPAAPAPQVRSASTPPDPGTPQAKHIVPRNDLFVPAGWRAQPMSAHNKVVAGSRDLISVENLGAMVISAGYSEITNGQPNYGTGAGAFAQRFGAAVVRETSQTAFSEIVFAPLLHEDPRYYQKGPAYNPVRRTLYAITRPLVTRSDSGSQTINGSLLLGYAAAAALTPAYYPSKNRNFSDVASTFGGSIGGAAIGFFISEFSTDVLQALHLRRND